MNFKNITIEYHYLELPAPYTYTKTLKISFSEAGLKTDYALKYTDREDFSEEELQDEGFTGNDDESWKGNIDTNWLQTLVHLKELKPGEKATSSNESIVHVDGRLIETYGNENKWDYFIQEITQAIYETAEWEGPLNIRYCRKKSEADKAPIQQLEISFSKRTATLNKTHTVSWEHVQQLLKLYYLQEFAEGEHSKKIPVAPGIYTDPGDGFWYDTEEASSSLDKIQKENLTEAFKGIFE
ncbi:MAG: hypothetical protein ACTHJT_02275 [Cytophaga sp.]|uniref:hypothetical protein n=1 Tax=Cytophaga sp. TaxID=29535 RepID=UPI003F81D0CD